MKLKILVSPALFLFFFCMLGGCAAPPDISGIYVHHDGTKKYYTLTVRKKSTSKVTLQFEGVPLDLMKRFPWSVQCDGQIRGRNLRCAQKKIEIKQSPLRLTVTYEDGEKQVFINSLEGQEEETILFK